MKAADYCRYSTDNQTENSIATQLDAITKYCHENDHALIATYVDEAQSGTNMNRQGFIDMLAGADNKLFEAVIIYDTTRGSRDVADWFTFRKQMQRLNIAVLSVTEELGDLHSPDNFLMEMMRVGLGNIKFYPPGRSLLPAQLKRQKKPFF